MLYVYLILCLSNCVFGMLWRNGIIHYTINNKDYDVHSQDVIISTLSQLKDEICLKFFQTSPDFNATVNNKILYINNPDKRKTCSPNTYDFSKIVVDMIIGYKCINHKDIARVVIEMIRASIDDGGTSINSYDLIKKFEEKDQEVIKSPLISSWERNFINSHYKFECSSPWSMQPTLRRRTNVQTFNQPDTFQLSADNIKYYADKLWPYGVVLYTVEDSLKDTPDFQALRQAMTSVELVSCVVFQEVNLKDALFAKNLIWFAAVGDAVPRYGFVEGKETLSLSSMVHGAAGHTAHALNNLLRVLGIPMMSNRADRDHYVTINWRNVEMGKEQYLEKVPEQAWVAQIPYDYSSATHAPANYMCVTCEQGAATVQPIQEDEGYRSYRRPVSPAEGEGCEGVPVSLSIRQPHPPVVLPVNETNEALMTD